MQSARKETTLKVLINVALIFAALIIADRGQNLKVFEAQIFAWTLSQCYAASEYV